MPAGAGGGGGGGVAGGGGGAAGANAIAPADGDDAASRQSSVPKSQVVRVRNVMIADLDRVFRKVVHNIEDLVVKAGETMMMAHKELDADFLCVAREATKLAWLWLGFEPAQTETGQNWAKGDAIDFGSKEVPKALAGEEKLKPKGMSDYASLHQFFLTNLVSECTLAPLESGSELMCKTALRETIDSLRAFFDMPRVEEARDAVKAQFEITRELIDLLKAVTQDLAKNIRKRAQAEKRDRDKSEKDKEDAEKKRKAAHLADSRKRAKTGVPSGVFALDIEKIASYTSPEEFTQAFI